MQYDQRLHPPDITPPPPRWTCPLGLLQQKYSPSPLRCFLSSVFTLVMGKGTNPTVHSCSTLHTSLCALHISPGWCTLCRWCLPFSMLLLQAASSLSSVSVWCDSHYPAFLFVCLCFWDLVKRKQNTSPPRAPPLPVPWSIFVSLNSLSCFMASNSFSLN